MRKRKNPKTNTKRDSKGRSVSSPSASLALASTGCAGYLPPLRFTCKPARNKRLSTGSEGWAPTESQYLKKMKKSYPIKTAVESSVIKFTKMDQSYLLHSFKFDTHSFLIIFSCSEEVNQVRKRFDVYRLKPSSSSSPNWYITNEPANPWIKRA